MNKTHEKILTISIAAYNVEEYLKDTLESLVVPSIFGKLEVLIIDDGSTDNTCRVARKYADLYPDAFRIISKQNGGWGSTVNTGIKEARGKYFRQLDGDDAYNSDALEEYILFLENCDSDLVISPYITFDDKDGKTLLTFDYPLQRNCSPSDISELVNVYNLAMHSAAVRTDILKDKNISLLEHCFYTDVEFMIKTFVYVNNYSYFDKNIYRYRIGRNDQSMSISSLKKHSKEHEKVLLSILELYKNLPDGDNKTIIKKRIEIAIRTNYDCLWLQGDKKDDIIRFDQFLRSGWPDLYKDCASKKILLSRLLRFRNYSSMNDFVTTHYKEIC